MNNMPKPRVRKHFFSLILTVVFLILLSASSFAEGTPPEASSPQATARGDDAQLTLILTWSGGPEANKTGIPLTLVRNGTEVNPQPDVTITPHSGIPNTFIYSWSNLPKTDDEGTPYVYTARVLNDKDGTLFHEECHYRVEQTDKGFTLSFEPPVRSLTADKTFEHVAPDGTRPLVKIVVQYSANLQDWEDAVSTSGEPMSFVTDKDMQKRWSTEFSDMDGNPYAFRLQETYVNPSPTDDNWYFQNEGFMSSMPPKNLICNGINSLIPDDHIIGELRITKELDNSDLNGNGGLGDVNGERLGFPVEVTGPYGYKKTVTVYPGETTVLKGLYYGEYTVKELGAEDYQVAMAPADGKVLLSRPPYGPDCMPTVNPVVGEVTITNKPKTGTDAVTDIKATKIWKGGPKEDHWAGEPTISLFQNGKKIGDNQAYLAADMTILPVEKGSDIYTYHWINLAKYDAKGYPFVYTVDETEVPDPYVKTVSADGLTFTNTYPVDKPEDPTKPEASVKPADPLKPEASDKQVGQVKKVTPKTGDDQNLWAYILLSAASLGLMRWAATRSRRKEEQ